MSDVLYHKVGRRYVPVGHEFTGFPADGYWLVEDGRQSLLVRIDAPRPLKKLRFQQYRDRLVDRILNHEKNKSGWSMYEATSTLLDELENLVNEDESANFSSDS